MSGIDLQHEPGVRTRRAGRRVAALLAMAAMLALATPALADEYDPKDAGHPLRIVGYVLHPVGVTIDYLLLRPAFWIGSHEPFRTLFGRTD
jgi:hypothetical protein